MTREPSPAASSGADDGASDRLDSWKDVAAYLRRDVTTVQRWERREGLPIRRHVHEKQGSVYAFRSELDTWQRTRTRQVEAEETDRPPVSEQVGPDPENGSASPLPSAQRPAATPRLALGRFSAVAGVIALVVAAIAFGVARGPVASSAPPDITSLVVLPLENLSGDPARAYLAAGLTDELTGRLAQLRALRVVSRTSAMAFEGRRVSLPAIGRELQVDAAIEGTVRYQDGRVKVSIQLVHAATDSHLWARDFERDAADLLQLQSDIAAAVADEVRVQIRPDERAALASVPRVDPKAHEEYLLGRYLLYKGVEEDRVRAIEHFHRAIRIAPDYAPPYAALAHAWWMRGIFGPLSIKEVASPARDAAREALSRDDRLAEAYAAQAYVQGVFDMDWAGAEVTIQRAVQLEPNSVDAHYVFAILMMAMGRLSEARAQIEHAARVDPLSAQVQSTFGRILYRARQFDAAVDRLNRAIELEPRNGRSYGRLADVYALMGRYDEALRLYEQANVHRGGQKDEFGSRIALTYARMGRRGDARRLLPGLQGPGDAAVHAALGDHDTAFTLLFRAVDGREYWFPFIKAEPDFDPLHADPRWNELLQRMRLESN